MRLDIEADVLITGIDFVIGIDNTPYALADKRRMPRNNADISPHDLNTVERAGQPAVFQEYEAFRTDASLCFPIVNSDDIKNGVIADEKFSSANPA